MIDDKGKDAWKTGKALVDPSAMITHMRGD